jgi:hypothetical protein
MSRPEPAVARQFSFADWTLRKRTARASLLLGVVLAALSAVLIVSVNTFGNRGDDVIERWQPADALSQNILADLVNQETGVRGYVLSRRTSLLAPYVHFRAVERVQEQRLRELLRGHDDLLAPSSTSTGCARGIRPWRSRRRPCRRRPRSTGSAARRRS